MTGTKRLSSEAATFPVPNWRRVWSKAYSARPLNGKSINNRERINMRRVVWTGPKREFFEKSRSLRKHFSLPV